MPRRTAAVATRFALLALLVLAPMLLAGGAEAQAGGKTLTANIDTTCSPCQDFFSYANGSWLKRAEIPAAYSSWGSFNELYDQNQEALRSLLDEAARRSTTDASSPLAKVGAFYGSCMDSIAAERAGATPISADLARIARIQSRAALLSEVGREHGSATNVLFRLTSTQDPKNTTRIIPDVAQGGLGLPDRDYYTKTDSQSVALRADYAAHIARTFELLGDTPASARVAAARVLDVETKLAGEQMSLVDQRDPNKIVNVMPVSKLSELAPAIDWRAYLAAQGVPTSGDVNVEQTDYLRGLNRLLATVPLSDWKSYLRWHVVQEASPYLGSRFVNENFRFFGAGLTGARELRPRWKRCIGVTDQYMGEALGQAYVAKHFTPETKQRAVAMVANIKAAMRERIAGLDWMSAETKQQAYAKLDAFSDKIGYPDKWRDYSALRITPGSLAGNVLVARTFENRRQLAKIGKPVDRGEWLMTPPTVDAYYNPLMNDINFPAGIMQPPFFDPNADDAVNYGGMGAVIGHEISHGFDDQGRQFDPQGNLRDWWTKEDNERFTQRAKVVVDQFNDYTVLDSLHVNGQLTLGENIADFAGLTLAYHALQKSMEGKPRPANIDGLTPEQRFFLGWAQIWRGKRRPESQRLQISVDPHAPFRWRVNGPLSNMPEFARAFGCRADDQMVREGGKRAAIW